MATRGSRGDSSKDKQDFCVRDSESISPMFLVNFYFFVRTRSRVNDRKIHGNRT